MREALKPVEWLGDSRARVRSFSKPVRQQVGYELEMVQHGLEPSDWRPLPIVGPGAAEIRIHAEGEHRIVYVAKFQKAIYVLHAFHKATRKTPRSVIAIARARYREVLKMEGSNR